MLGGAAMSPEFRVLRLLLVVAVVYLHLPQRLQSVFLLGGQLGILRAGHAGHAARDHRCCGVHLTCAAAA